MPHKGSYGKTLAEQGSAERRKRDQAITSAQGGSTSKKPKASKPTNKSMSQYTPAQTARMRKGRDIESQVGAATGGQTTKRKAKEPQLRKLVKELKGRR
jgi:hypothetical protein